MKINKSKTSSLDFIFKMYDVRGLYPKELNEETAYVIGRAFVKFLGSQAKRSGEKKLKIVVGRDNRLSSVSLFKSLSRGIKDQGADVVDIGLSTSPMLYWSCANYKFDGGINITASHNPPEYNGFKFVRENATPISSETGLKTIQQLILEGFDKEAKKGRLTKKEIIREYLKFNFKSFKIASFCKAKAKRTQRDKSLFATHFVRERKESKAFFEPLKNKKKIVIDTANGVGGILIPHLSVLNCQIIHIFKKLDGSFPNHHPDPLKEENLVSLKKEVLLKKADFGVAFDGDADRMIFVDEKGETVRGDLIIALLAKFFLKEQPGHKIIYDIRSSNVVPETIKESGGIPIFYKIGHSFIKEKMRKEQVFFAGELSGHYYLKEHYFFEAPLFILIKVLEILNSENKTFKEIIEPYKKYYYSGEINFEVKEKEKTIKKLEKKFNAGKKTKLDGLRVDFKDWWFLVRPSGTENLLRLVIEAKTKELLNKKKKELSSYLQN